MTESKPADVEHAVLGGGCFWCLEAVFRDLDGVTGVESGYAGGHVDAPTYEDVCNGRTGHAEVVDIAFDSQRISYADLLRVFFTIHDPTTRDRQGNDVGSQYRSVIFAQSAQQRMTAKDVMDELSTQQIWPAPLVTQLEDAATFHPAERHHQEYFERNPNQPYCMAVVAPKVSKFRKQYADRLKRH